MAPDLVTRTELASLAQRAGLNITERTLRYWATKELIPRPCKVRGRGNRVFYPVTLLSRLCVLELVRGRKTLAQVRSDMEQVGLREVGDKVFVVLATLRRYADGKVERTWEHTLDGLVYTYTPKEKA